MQSCSENEHLISQMSIFDTFSFPIKLGITKNKALEVFWSKGEVKVMEKKLHCVLSYKIQ